MTNFKIPFLPCVLLVSSLVAVVVAVAEGYQPLELLTAAPKEKLPLAVCEREYHNDLLHFVANAHDYMPTHLKHANLHCSYGNCIPKSIT